jgi:hypothetical protein
LTALGYAVQKGDLQETRDIIRGEPRWLLNDADYQMNSPVVSAFLPSQRPDAYLHPLSYLPRTVTQPKLSLFLHRVGAGIGKDAYVCSVSGHYYLRQAASIIVIDKGARRRRHRTHISKQLISVSQHRGNTQSLIFRLSIALA